MSNLTRSTEMKTKLEQLLELNNQFLRRVSLDELILKLNNRITDNMKLYTKVSGIGNEIFYRVNSESGELLLDIPLTEVPNSVLSDDMWELKKKILRRKGVLPCRLRK